MNAGIRLFHKKDWWLAAGILAVACLIYSVFQLQPGRDGAKAVIYYASEPVEMVPLTKGVERQFSIPQNEQVVFHLFPDGTICFEESDCPDKICIRTGRLGRAGESAACLPNRIVIKIVPADGKDRENVDITTG